MSVKPEKIPLMAVPNGRKDPFRASCFAKRGALFYFYNFYYNITFFTYLSSKISFSDRKIFKSQKNIILFKFPQLFRIRKPAPLVFENERVRIEQELYDIVVHLRALSLRVAL